ncbi:MAG: hypothetical protein WC081_05575 [Candidatus Ratteibacteria bacterium]|jgi:hypothetical protein
MKNKLLLSWCIHLFIFAVFLVGCATIPDPIDRLTANYSASHGLWENGAFPILDLPETTLPEQVIKRIFEMTGFDKGYVTNYRILKIRQVHIQGSLPDLYTAALVQTNFGEKIVLFKYEGSGWWSRVCDAKTSD